jgi:hypothetical protein
MKIKTDKSQKKSQLKWEDLSPAEREFIDNAIVSDEIYDAVVSQLNIDPEDQLYRNLMIGILKRHTIDNIVFNIWNALSDGLIDQLDNYVAYTLSVAPWMEHEDILIEFAVRYPDLKERVFAGLNDFFKDFIKRYNEL